MLVLLCAQQSETIYACIAPSCLTYSDVMADAERFPDPESEELTPAQSSLIRLADDVMSPAPDNIHAWRVHLMTDPVEIERHLRASVFGHMILRNGRSLAEPGSEGEETFPDLVVSPEKLVIATMGAYRSEIVTSSNNQRNPRGWVREASVGLWYRHHEDSHGGIEIRVRGSGVEGVSNKSMSVSRSVWGPITAADATYHTHTNLTVERSADTDVIELLDYMRELYEQSVHTIPPNAS